MVGGTIVQNRVAQVLDLKSAGPGGICRERCTATENLHFLSWPAPVWSIAVDAWCGALVATTVPLLPPVSSGSSRGGQLMMSIDLRHRLGIAAQEAGSAQVSLVVHTSSEQVAFTRMASATCSKSARGISSSLRPRHCRASRDLISGVPGCKTQLILIWMARAADPGEAMVQEARTNPASGAAQPARVNMSETS